MKKFFSILLKIFGYILTFTLVIGGGHVITRDADIYFGNMKAFSALLVVILFYLAAAWLCFWGSKKLKNNNNQKENNQS